MRPLVWRSPREQVIRSTFWRNRGLAIAFDTSDRPVRQRDKPTIVSGRSSCGGRRRGESLNRLEHGIRMFAALLLVVVIGLPAFAQEQSQPTQAGQIPRQEAKPPEAPVEPERWNLFYQATSIGQYHGMFH